MTDPSMSRMMHPGFRSGVKTAPAPTTVPPVVVPKPVVLPGTPSSVPFKRPGVKPPVKPTVPNVPTPLLPPAVSPPKIPKPKVPTPPAPKLPPFPGTKPRFPPLPRPSRLPGRIPLPKIPLPRLPFRVPSPFKIPIPIDVGDFIIPEPLSDGDFPDQYNLPYLSDGSINRPTGRIPNAAAGASGTGEIDGEPSFPSFNPDCEHLFRQYWGGNKLGFSLSNLGVQDKLSYYESGRIKTENASADFQWNYESTARTTRYRLEDDAWVIHSQTETTASSNDWQYQFSGSGVPGSEYFVDVLPKVLSASGGRRGYQANDTSTYPSITEWTYSKREYRIQWQWLARPDNDTHVPDVNVEYSNIPFNNILNVDNYFDPLTCLLPQTQSDSQQPEQDEDMSCRFNDEVSRQNRELLRITTRQAEQIEGLGTEQKGLAAVVKILLDYLGVTTSEHYQASRQNLATTAFLTFRSVTHRAGQCNSWIMKIHNFRYTTAVQLPSYLANCRYTKGSECMHLKLRDNANWQVNATSADECLRVWNEIAKPLIDPNLLPLKIPTNRDTKPNNGQVDFTGQVRLANIRVFDIDGNPLFRKSYPKA